MLISMVIDIIIVIVFIGESKCKSKSLILVTSLLLLSSIAGNRGNHGYRDHIMDVWIPCPHHGCMDTVSSRWSFQQCYEALGDYGRFIN